MTSNVSPETSAETSAGTNTINKQVNNSPLVGVLLIVLGIVGLALPIFSTLVAETWVAFILISAGAAKVVYAFQTRDRGGFIWKLLLGVLYVATGLMLFVYPRTGILTLTLLLGSFFLTEGVFETILAFRLRPQQNWTWALVNGIVTLAFGGIVLFQWPFNAPWLIGTLVGASVLFSGVSRVMLSFGRGSDSAMNQTDSAASA
ncbi:HdeD family acid-resistance protein [Leptolyngbya sp. FACHB-671]|uniref:HdeD family acid-resistance protein n=1 Tax=Leptolyngbya sp. FACHB-671 TaxID=2692812 RepID=UPI00168A2F06|nr:HdeD family acid-resistance protein [Leptolyngbya sp. FACHB-671]MBD1870003.1 HdeD family acid-resistance protein [Cyanobacteria bacterium FACHB-471]MBD2069617.1 HdeD family acid-resistance protein [Leptolyngbya sp. FACHB-671]